MKNTLRIMSALFAFVLCLGLLAACGSGTGADKGTTAANNNDAVPPTETAGTEPFVAPPDQVGKIIAADSTLITWNTYAPSDETIDFMSVDVKTLGDASAEATLCYLEGDVTCYLISEGKLVDATIDDVVPGSVVGVTTLEEGVQELYILYVPVEDDGSDDDDDILEEIIPEEDIEAAEDTATTD